MIKKLSPPLQNWSLAGRLTHMFGVNPKLYAYLGMPGHPGLDLRGEYDEPVLAMHDGHITKVGKDSSAGNNIKICMPDNSLCTAYLHLSRFNNVYAGMPVTAGQIIGFLGNSGGVLPAPTPAEPHLGKHLHIGVQIPGKINEYKGYVDPVPYLFVPGDRIPLKLVYDLSFGSNNDQVSLLQTMLKLEGFAKDYEPLHYFGFKTLRDVRLLQSFYGLTPTIGYCGTKTRALLNKRFSAY